MIHFGKQRSCGVLLATLLIAMVPGPALCQTISRPASVTLVATLESLSISASSPSIAVSSDDARRVIVTTRWAVPAELTTVSLTARFERKVASLSEPVRLSPLPQNRASGATADRMGDSLPSASNGHWILRQGGGTVRLFEQAAGRTNQPTTRNDHLDLVDQVPGGRISGTGKPSGTLYIVVEGL